MSDEKYKGKHTGRPPNKPPPKNIETEQYRRLIDNIPGAVYRCFIDKYWTMEFISPAIQTISGFKADEFINNRVRSYTSIIHPDDTDMVAKKVNSAVRQAEPYVLYYRVIDANGDVKWVYEKGIAYYDEDRVPLWLDGVIFDCTEQYKTMRTLETEHTQLLSIFDSMDEVIYIAHPKSYKLLYGNEIFRKNFGDPIGQKCYQALQGRDDPCPFCTNEHIFGKNLGKTYIWEFRNQVNNRWYHCIDRAIKWTDGSMVRFEMAVDNHDLKMTQIELDEYQKHLENLVKERTIQLDVAKQQAEKSSAAKSDFLTSMSHELRTPLNAILGYSRLLQKDRSLSTTQINSLKIINRSGEHLLALINEVLTLSKIEAGQISLDITACDLHSLLYDVAGMFHSSLETKGLYFELIGINDVPQYILADNNKLRQVLVNMLGNAVKFTDKGGVVMSVGIRDKTAAPIQLRIAIKDTGQGIADDEFDKVFAFFEQTASGLNKNSGTGLGLAISRNYVRMMDGDINLKSTVGEGSIFTVDIPVQECTESDINKKNTGEKTVTGLKSNVPTPLVLVAEDQRESRLLLSQLLRSVGIKVLEATNGKEAMDLFQKRQPDFIWMDIRMPVVDGLEATRAIKASEAGNSVTVVALTAHALDEEKKHILAAGCDDFVSKPFHENEIFEVMQRHLGLEYLYHEDANDMKHKGGEINFLPEELNGISDNLLNRLYTSVVELNIETSSKIIDEISDQNPEIGKRLCVFIDDLNFNGLLNLIEAYGIQPGTS